MTVEELERNQSLISNEAKETAFSYFERNRTKLKRLNKSELARSLAVSRQTVYNWLKEFEENKSL